MFLEHTFDPKRSMIALGLGLGLATAVGVAASHEGQKASALPYRVILPPIQVGGVEKEYQLVTNENGFHGEDAHSIVAFTQRCENGSSVIYTSWRHPRSPQISVVLNNGSLDNEGNFAFRMHPENATSTTISQELEYFQPLRNMPAEDVQPVLESGRRYSLTTWDGAALGANKAVFTVLDCSFQAPASLYRKR